jgi:hypothetical protein
VREIQAFRETKHFGTEVSFDQGSWRATWETASHLAADEKYSPIHWHCDA